MRVSVIAFWLVGLAALSIFPLATANWLTPWLLEPVEGFLVDIVLSSLGANVGLMIWMFVHCVWFSELAPRQRRQWELLLLAGAGITAFVYLYGVLLDRRERRS